MQIVRMTMKSVQTRLMRHRALWVLSTAALAGLVGCSSTPQEALKSEIKDHLKNRYPSYQPEQIVIVDTMYTSFEETTFYQEAEDQLLRLEGDSAAKANMMQNELGDPIALEKKMDSIENQLEAVRERVDQRRSSYQPRPSYFIVEHRFVARQEDGKMLDGRFRIKADTSAKVVEIAPMEEEKNSGNTP